MNDDMFRATIAVHVKAPDRVKAESNLASLLRTAESLFANHGIALVWVENLPKPLSKPYRAPRSMGMRCTASALTAEDRLSALKALVEGDWDHPILMRFGPLHVDPSKNHLRVLYEDPERESTT